MNWLKDFFWCDTWAEFFQNLILAAFLLVGFWALIWIVYALTEVL